MKFSDDESPSAHVVETQCSMQMHKMKDSEAQKGASPTKRATKLYQPFHVADDVSD